VQLTLFARDVASLKVTLENNQTAVKAIGNIGWDWQNGGFRVRGQIDYVTLLKVHVDVLPPNKLIRFFTKFPKEVEIQRHGNDSLYCDLNPPRLEVVADLIKHRTILDRGKAGVYWRPNQPISTYIANLWLTLTIYIQPRYQTQREVTWEHDLLPFLPGGQFESKRSRH
jgi:hypothetical protein